MKNLTKYTSKNKVITYIIGINIYNSPNIEMEICYSKVQGKQLLIKRFFPNNPILNANLIKDCWIIKIL